MSIKHVAIVLVVVVLGGVGFWFGLDWAYLSPRAEKVAEIERLEGLVVKQRDRHHDLRVYERQRAEVAQRTLGGDVEKVTHRLRTRLNRINEVVGTGEPSVSTGTAKRLATPAKSQFSSRSAFRKALRNEPDFTEINATVTGRGSFDQVLTLIDMIDAEPWMKRVDGLSLSPRENGEQFQFVIQLTTVFLEGEGPDELAEHSYDSLRRDRFLALATNNPFRIPPPPEPAVVEPTVVEPVVVAVADPPKPRFPYRQWSISGIIAAAPTPEVWLVNKKTGERRHLAIGDRIGDAKLTRAEGETAWFELEEQRFSVLLGKTLDHRAPESGQDSSL